MAFEEYDNYEQSELVQKWLRENGLSIVAGIAIGLVGIFGYQQWRGHIARHEDEASQLYQEAQVARESGRADLAAQLTAQLMKDYEKSAFAVLAVSAQAAQEVQDKQPEKAENSLKWAQAHASEPELKSLTELHLAQVEFSRGDSKAAIAALDSMPSTDYQGLAQELRGDVLVKLGRPDDARNAYNAAKSALSDEAPQRGALQLKIDDLAVAGKQGA
jgi:predicted negative regulator of RcsB-dependent stress response